VAPYILFLGVPACGGNATWPNAIAENEADDHAKQVVHLSLARDRDPNERKGPEGVVTTRP